MYLDMSHVKSLYQFFCDYGYPYFKLAEVDCDMNELVFVNADPMQDELHIEMTCCLDNLIGSSLNVISPYPHLYNPAQFQHVGAVHEIGVYQAYECIAVYSDRRKV